MMRLFDARLKNNDDTITNDIAKDWKLSLVMKTEPNLEMQIKWIKMFVEY